MLTPWLLTFSPIIQDLSKDWSKQHTTFFKIQAINPEISRTFDKATKGEHGGKGAGKAQPEEKASKAQFLHVDSHSAVDIEKQYTQAEEGNSIKWPVHSLTLRMPFPDLTYSMWPTATNLQAKWAAANSKKPRNGK